MFSTMTLEELEVFDELPVPEYLKAWLVCLVPLSCEDPGTWDMEVNGALSAPEGQCTEGPLNQGLMVVLWLVASQAI